MELLARHDRMAHFGHWTVYDRGVNRRHCSGQQCMDTA